MMVTFTQEVRRHSSSAMKGRYSGTPGRTIRSPTLVVRSSSARRS